MARAPKAKPAGQKPNTYNADDMKKVIEAIEAYEAEQRSIRSEAAGRCGGIAKKIEDEKKTAANLGIPKRLLVTTLKQRALEKKLKDLVDDVPEDMIELYEEASGQFSIFQPTAEELGRSNIVSPVTLAARRAARAAKDNLAKEQAEGEKMLGTINNVDGPQAN